MPAYFNISVQFSRKDIYHNFMNDFYAAVEQAGLLFRSGYYEETEKQIVQWNQQKIEQNFELGFTEHCIDDYKQSCFNFGNYSEVRGFWLNHYPENGLFTYEIIIPESDVLTEEDGSVFRKEVAYELLELSKKIWKFQYIKVIQTGLEFHDEATAVTDIEKGELPNITPFAIVEQKNTQFIHSKYYFNETLQRNGILLCLPTLKVPLSL